MNWDFRNIDVMEQLADPESPDIRSPLGLVERTKQRRDELDNGIKLPWGKLDGLVKLRSGEVITLAGYSGHHKSTVSSQIALSAMRQGFRVGVASLEMPAEDVMELYAEMAAGRTRVPFDYFECFAKWADQKLFIYDRVDVINPNEAIQLTIAMRKFFGADLVILDCLFMMGVNGDNEADFIRTLAAVAKKFDITVLLVHHVRKPQGDKGEAIIPDKYSLLGSSHLVNATSSLIFTWHNKAKAYSANAGMTVNDSEPDLLIKVAKQRNGKYEGVTKYWQHDRCRAFCSNQHRKLEPMNFPKLEGVA